MWISIVTSKGRHRCSACGVKLKKDEKFLQIGQFMGSGNICSDCLHTLTSIYDHSSEDDEKEIILVNGPRYKDIKK